MSHTATYLQSLRSVIDADISTLVDYIVHDAVQSGASDIHFEPWQESMAVRIRVTGQLIEMVHLPSELREKISGRFKVMASLASHLSGVPQDGKVNMGPEFGSSRKAGRNQQFAQRQRQIAPSARSCRRCSTTTWRRPPWPSFPPRRPHRSRAPALPRGRRAGAAGARATPPDAAAG